MLKSNWWVLGLGLLMLLDVAHAQTDSMEVIYPNNTREITAEADTLWILSDQQMEEALTMAEKGAMFDSCMQRFDTFKAFHDSVLNRKDRIIERLDSGYTRYRDKWEASNKKIEELRVNLEKARSRQFNTALIAGGSGIVLTALVFLFL
jgi:hypothetical protein